MTSEPQSAVVEPSACWSLLRSTDLGRLAVTGPEGPDIFPVNFAVDRGTLVFRTARGTKLDALTQHPAVAFEVDGHDEAVGEAWSVVVKGRAEQVRGFVGLLDTSELEIYPWEAAPKAQFVRIVVDQISGRRFRRADPRRWDDPLTGIEPRPFD